MADLSMKQMVEKCIAEGVSSPKDGAEYIKVKFGADITPKYFSMIKGKMKDNDPSPAASPTEEAPASLMSKADAVRRCLAAGIEKPQEAVAWIKSNCGIDIPTEVFGSYKSNEKKKLAEANGTPAPRAAKPAAPVSSGNGLAADVKALIDRHGLENVKNMIEAAEIFGK